MVKGPERDDYVRIVTSADGPYAISDTIKQNIAVVQSYLLISAPWVSKPFIDCLRNLVPKDVALNVLIRFPDNKYGKADYTFYSINSLLEIADERAWKVIVKCNPDIHAKFIVIDDLTCLFSTANPTDSGIYYNLEAVAEFKGHYVQEFSEFFYQVWDKRENVNFEHLRVFNGIEPTLNQFDGKGIAEAAIRHCRKNGNCRIPKWQICKDIMKLGYEESAVITVLRNMVKDGVLYEPSDDYYRIVE